jgi:hypothetical protein
VHVESNDEMTGIQALERTAPTKPARPGLIERREFEYIRHGTLSLIANFEVATGLITAASLGPTRTEVDYVRHIEKRLETDPAGEWIFICDQLNTHQAASLVELIARYCKLSIDLGIKGASGILKNMATRKAFLEDKSHRIRFVFTPKHSSWLNQIEIWFSILVRRLLKRGNFTSQEDLSQQILGFIAYFNQVMAKPFKWTYKGRPLQV